MDCILNEMAKLNNYTERNTTHNSGFVKAGFECISGRAGVCTFFSELRFFLSNFSVYL